MSFDVDTNQKADSKPPRSLTSKAFKGAAWSAGNRVLVQGISFAGTLVLARILTPKVYGIIGVARLTTGFLDIFRELGTAAAVVQRDELNEALLSTMFWTNVGLGVISSATVIAIAPLIAQFFREPLTGPVMQVLSAGFLFSSLSTVHISLLARRMEFGKIAVVEIAAAAITTTCGIIMAWLGDGVWSLAIPTILGAAASTILLWSFEHWRPKQKFAWAEAKSIASFSLNLSGFTAVNYLSRNADNAVVGRFLGMSQLGFYQLAYNVMLYAMQNVSAVLGRVLFPAFAQVKHDNRRFRQAYTKAVAMIAIITFPAMAGLTIIARPFVATVLGMKWLPVARLITILAPIGLMQSVINTTGNIYIAKGRTDWLFRWGVVSTIVCICSFFIGLPWGINGVATAYLVANLALIYPVFAIPFRLIELKMLDFLKPLSPVIGCSITMAAILKLVLVAGVLEKMPFTIQLLLLVAIGSFTYGLLLFAFRPGALLDLIAAAEHLAKKSRTTRHQLSNT